MKKSISFFIIGFLSLSSAAIETSSANDACLKSATSWAIKSEAKKTKTKSDKIKNLETKSLGNGANLYLVSIFVEGPNTGENTHWEIVGEFNLRNNSCKILLGQRYWAH